MTDVSVYTPLKTIVSYTLDELGKSMGDFDRCWVLAFRAMVAMKFSFEGQAITVRLPVQANKTVPFPANCLSWSKVGILNEKGETVTLKINNALTRFRDVNPQRLQDLTPDINNSIQSIPIVPYYSNFFYGGNYYQLFGLGNGLVTYGECRV